MKYKSSMIYLEDILEAMNKIERFIKDIEYDTFIKDDMMVDAVLKNLIIIGEAGKNIPAGIKKNHQDVPWKRIIGLRNIVVHKYHGVDLEIIWKIVTENIPDTKPLIERIIKSLKER